MNEIVVSVKNIKKTYKEGHEKIIVLEDVSFDIEKGVIAAVMGESGSGKTTLLNLLGTLDVPDKGMIIYNNKEILKMNNKEIPLFRNKNIGFLFQFHYLLSDFTAIENIIMPAIMAGEDKEKYYKYAEGLMEKVGLKKRMYHHPTELSGGEQQRTAALRAIINNPTLVLADEPCGNLDRTNTQNLLDIIFELGRDVKQTFLIATHSLNIAKRCDKIFYLSEGRIKENYAL